MDKQSAQERHKRLTDEGWVRRFTADEPRLSEMKQLYESMGLEVLVEAAAPEESQECQSCFDLEGSGDRYKTIYTRGEFGQPAESDDLFP
jgi:hypothetical protein